MRKNCLEITTVCLKLRFSHAISLIIIIIILWIRSIWNYRIKLF